MAYLHQNALFPFDHLSPYQNKIFHDYRFKVDHTDTSNLNGSYLISKIRTIESKQKETVLMDNYDKEKKISDLNQMKKDLLKSLRSKNKQLAIRNNEKEFQRKKLKNYKKSNDPAYVDSRNGLKILEWDYLIDSFYDNNDSIKEAADLNYAFNCCIIGFKDKQIAMDYANKSLILFEYLNKNNANIPTLKDNYFLPTIAEQLFLSFYSKYHNLKGFNFSDDINNPCYMHLGSEKHKYHKDILKFININAPNIYENLLKYIV
jgi:hypothetical protein